MRNLCNAYHATLSSTKDLIKKGPMFFDRILYSWEFSWGGGIFGTIFERRGNFGTIFRKILNETLMNYKIAISELF